METIQVVLDEELLKAADAAAKRRKTNRSKLIREALQEHLKRLHTLELEKREQRAYKAYPDTLDDFRPFEEAAVWPDD
jgi:metal-responsive CopG/Arc/MetJ family transcriptional regulator